MSEDRFLNRIRDEARQLRYQPADDAIWTRLLARVDARLHAQPRTSHLLAGWFRPVAATLAAVSVAAALSIPWMERTDAPSTVEAMVTASAPAVDLAVDGDAASVE